MNKQNNVDKYMEEFVECLAFEADFYEALAGSDDYDIIAFPKEDGTYPTKDDTEDFLRKLRKT